MYGGWFQELPQNIHCSLKLTDQKENDTLWSGVLAEKILTDCGMFNCSRMFWSIQQFVNLAKMFCIIRIACQEAVPPHTFILTLRIMSFLTTASQSVLITYIGSAYTSPRIQLFICLFVSSLCMQRLPQCTHFDHLKVFFSQSKYFDYSTLLLELKIFMCENVLMTTLSFKDRMKDARPGFKLVEEQMLSVNVKEN